MNNEKWHKRFCEKIPWGSGTCSKAPLYMPEEPAALERGFGCRVQDVDGRIFIDFRNGLGPVTLGYCYPAVDEAIKKQLEKGILYGHPHTLECEVAEMFCDMIPCADQARFLKTGGEAIAACIRIARAYTGREHVLQIGYNGWLNSLAKSGTALPGRNREGVPPGVPACLSDLHHSCGWNDMDALIELFSLHENDIAAVMIAADYEHMENGCDFYPKVRELTKKHGALLIFDEIVTGFRIAKGGVQEYFNVVPDMAVFGKGIANGMPISVYAGKKEIMAVCDKKGKVIISSTFAGETLSLAAAKAALDVYVNNDVTGHLFRQGEKMWSNTNRLFEKYDIPLCFKGLYPCPSLTLTESGNADIREEFFRKAYKNGVSLYNVPYVNFSHEDSDIDEALAKLEQACDQIRKG